MKGTIALGHAFAEPAAWVLGPPTAPHAAPLPHPSPPLFFPTTTAQAGLDNAGMVALTRQEVEERLRPTAFCLSPLVATMLIRVHVTRMVAVQAASSMGRSMRQNMSIVKAAVLQRKESGAFAATTSERDLMQPRGGQPGDGKGGSHGEADHN